MDEDLLRTIHSEGSRLIREFTPPREIAAGWSPESFETALAIEKHRWFWRPNRVKFVLLAESHVFTDADDMMCKIKRDQLPLSAQTCPDQFVRLVYCLGYGSNEILDRPPRQTNAGTDDYWELFGKCAGTWTVPNFSLPWKVQTLEALRDKGIWLADASIHACMNPRRPPHWKNLASKSRTKALYRDLISISWVYVRPTIENANEIWYIGKTVRSALRDNILNAEKYIPQPAAARQNRNHRREYDEQLPKLIMAINNICG